MKNDSVDNQKLRTEEYEAATKEKRILIVEDNDYKYEEVKDLLQKYKLKNYVRKTAVGKSFFECINGEKEVDIIILDTQFPRNLYGPIIDDAGVELIRKLMQNQRLGRLKRIPQIIGFSTEDFCEKYLRYQKMTGEDMTTQFVGQGKNIHEVEEILKRVLDL